MFLHSKPRIHKSLVFTHVSSYLSTVKVKTNWPTALSAFKILIGLQTREKFNIVIRCLLFYFAIQLNFLASFLINIGGYQLSHTLQHKSVSLIIMMNSFFVSNSWRWLANWSFSWEITHNFHRLITSFPLSYYLMNLTVLLI